MNTGKTLARALVAAALSLALFAAQAKAEEVTVESETVSAPEAAHPTATATVIDTTESMRRMSNVSEALEQSAGITIRRFGGLGDFSMILVRGTSPNQVGIYLDGMPLSNAASGLVNLSELPLDSLSRIEVYRGAAPLNLGSNIGGAVNLVTASAPGSWGFGVSQSYGSFTTWKSDLYQYGMFGKFSGLVYYTHLESEGDFEFLDDNGTPFNDADDETVERQNNDFVSDDFLLKGSWKPAAGWEIFMGDEFYSKQSGVPGIGAFQASKARLDVLRNSFYFGAKHLASSYEFQALAFFTYGDEQFHDPLGEIGVGVQKSRYLTATYGANDTFRYFISNRAAVALFTEARGEWYKTIDLLHDADQPTSSRVALTGALQGEVYMLKSRLILVPTLRVEYYRNEFSGQDASSGAIVSAESSAQETLFSPQFGVKAKPLNILTLHANVGQYYRLPTFSELFGDRGSVIGNPKLDVESGVHSDAGATLSLKRLGYLDSLTASYTFFYITVQDLIIMNQNSQRTVRAENVGEAEIAGHELMVEGQAFDHVRARAAYTYQQAADRSDIPSSSGRPLPGRPANELHFSLTLYQKRWGSVYYSLDYLDGNFLDRSGLLEVPARTIHGAGVSFIPIRNLVFTLEGKNLGDERIFDVLGYPLPGMSWFITASYKYNNTPHSEAANTTTEGETE